MTDTSYKLHTKSNGTIVCRSDSTGPNITTRGQAVEFTLWLPDPKSELVVSGSRTISETEVYGSVTVENGATLTITGALYTAEVTNNGTIDNQGDLVVDGAVTTWFDTLIQYGDYAGNTTVVETLNGEYSYREFISSSTDIDSLLVGVEPSGDLVDKNITGIWGLISSVSDPRGTALNTHRYTISVTILAEYSDYNNHGSAESDLKV